MPASQSEAGRPLAALTGGTGFLGRYIVHALAQAGWRLRLLTRSEPMHPLTADIPTELVLGDLSDADALERLCAGADLVVHAAGLIRARNRAGFFAVNADGSARLARAVAKAAPGARMIVLSSMAAREPQLSDYAASKHAGEVSVRENAPGPVTFLRPSAIYGRWDRATFPLFKMAENGLVFTPNIPDARACLIEASDVARAVVAVAGAEAHDATYELCDETLGGYSWREIALAAGRAAGKRPRIVTIPVWTCATAGFALENLARLTGEAPVLSRGKIREMRHGDWSSSVAHQPPPAIWRPEVTLETGFLTTLLWYKSENWL